MFFEIFGWTVTCIVAAGKVSLANRCLSPSAKMAPFPSMTSDGLGITVMMGLFNEVI